MRVCYEIEDNKMSNNQKVIVVTGASRGVGKGAALGLADAGHVLYISGRSKQQGDTSELPGTLEITAQLVRERGAQCVPVYCDHADDGQIESLIDQVISEQGRIDLLA